MTLTETQQAILTQAGRRSDGLAISPAHLPPGPRAAMAKGLLAAGLVIRADPIDAEPDAGWKLDGQVTFLRIANAGRQAIGADEPAVEAPESRPESGGVSAAGAGETVDSAATASEAAKPPVTRPGSRAPKLREAAAALLARWEETTAREPLADVIADLRTALSPARPIGSQRAPRQGTKQQSGLGMEAQQTSVRAFAFAQGWTLIDEFSDVASGKDDRRPGFQAALVRCRQLGAVLVAARLDRITRRAHTLSQPLEDGYSVRAADMPGADDLMMRIYAAMAQKERELISERTRAALAAAKARGAGLGGDRGYRPAVPPDASAASIARSDEADRTAHRICIEIDQLRRSGVTTLQALARELTALGVPTPRNGGAWTHTTVARAIERTQPDARGQ